MAEIISIVTNTITLAEKIISLARSGDNLYLNFAGEIEAVKWDLELINSTVTDKATKADQQREAIERALRTLSHELQHVLDRITLLNRTKTLNMVYELVHSLAPCVPSPTHEIPEKIKQIQDRVALVHRILQIPRVRSQSSSTELAHQVPSLPRDAVVLGVEKTKQELVTQLVNTKDKNLRAVVVVGPPGSGKTALVSLVCSSKQVGRRFGCKLDARVSRHFDARAVLSHLESKCRRRKTVPTSVVTTDLSNNLKGKRYLVVLDDVWRAEDWRAIKSVLPDESNGSRVVITTTKEDVAHSINASGSIHTHRMEGLKEEDSWELFCIKAFAAEKKTCPSELEASSREIVRKCEGSPLALSTVGDFMARVKRSPTEWAQVAGNLRAEMESSGPQLSCLKNSMQQSYDDLNRHLKRCLLYFSLFPEGCDVEWERLVRLWLAEGFVNQTGERPAEKVAEGYLEELVGRNLVVANEDVDGCIKSCRVSSFMSYFLTITSRKEGFADVLDKPGMQGVENTQRLFITDAFSRGEREKVQGKLCTVLFGGVSLPRVREICRQHKFLKVLDFGGAPLQEFPECVVNLGLLRYLSLRGSIDIDRVPSSIKKLCDLMFLDLTNTSVTRLPREICSLQHLQHLLVYLENHENTYETFQSVQGVKMSGQIGSLSNLRKLTLLKAKNHIGQLKNLRQLQELGLIELKRSDGRKLFNSLANMENLSVLDLRSVNEQETLDLDYPLPSNNLRRVSLKGPLEKLPSWLTSLRGLVRLHLKWSRLMSSSSINELQGLSALAELHLVDTFTDSKLVFQNTAFEGLKVLRIQDFAELITLEIRKGSMCRLEKLILCRCKQLKTVRVHNLSQLEELVLLDMPVELTNRLRRSGLDNSRIKVHNSSSPDVAQPTWPEHIRDMVLPLVHSVKDYLASRFM